MYENTADELSPAMKRRNIGFYYTYEMNVFTLQTRMYSMLY